MQSQGLNPGMTFFFEGDDSTVADGQLSIHETGSEDFLTGLVCQGKWSVEKELLGSLYIKEGTVVLPSESKVRVAGGKTDFVLHRLFWRRKRKQLMNADNASTNSLSPASLV